MTTRPVLHDCWSVNVSATGIGLTAGSGKEGGPTPGARLELAFKLPDGEVVTARGRIMWATPVPTGRQPNVAFGVEFEPLVPAAADALDRYLRRNRLRVGVAFAEDREAAVLSSTFADRGNLLFASTPEQAQRLASQGNLAALLICGQEAQAAALVERLGGLEQLQAEGNAGAALPARPRLIFCAPINGHRLVKFFNSGWIYRWLPPPLVPSAVEETVSAACADFAWHAEREHMALALASARRDLAEAAAKAPAAGAPVPPVAFAKTAMAAPPPPPLPPPPPAVGTRGWTEERTPGPSVGRPLPLRTVTDSGRYEDPKPIAEGGMGVVVAYTDNRLARRVALKRLQAQYADDPEMAAALEREARVTGNLEHPNIIPLYDAGRDERGRPFYVMKLVKAPTLAEVLERLHNRQEPTASHPPGQLLRAFVQVCQAVDYAHSRGVIHCDLKPGNVLIGRYGQVLVVDWGLAYVAADGTVCRGGTPGYASPEQTDPNASIDARTDVYGLGSILYELLCQRPPFDDQAYWGAEGFRHPRQLPVNPRQVSSRSVPEELVEICLRALAVAPADRYPSAGALATAIEAFLEGTKERQRRRQRGDALIETADELAANYFELLASRPERVAAIESLRASVAPWEPPERKRELWDAEDSLAVTDTLTVRTLQAAASTYEQALDEIRDDDEARRGLVRLYVSELRRAEQRRDERDRVYFEGLVNRHDDGTFARAAASSGSLTLECSAADAVVELARVEEQGRRLVAAAARTLGRPPLREIPLALGNYLVTVTAPGVRAVRFPILVKGGGRVRLFADLPGLRDGPAGEVLIPGGPAMLGGDEGAAGGRQMSEAQVASFYIQEGPVSFGEYLQFLTDVMKTLGQTAAPLIPRHGHNAPFWRWTGGAFELAEMSQWGDDPSELLEIPVFGIDLRGAEGYAQWKSRQTGRRYRLPTEEEWEKAGRGTDGRLYPWGNHFDASFCCMRESRPGTPRPRPRGQFAADVSPFGVWDMAGGVAEWTTPSTAALRKGGRETVTRGGSWCDWRTDCLLAGHRTYMVGERSARVGFRLVREGPTTVGYEIT